MKTELDNRESKVMDFIDNTNKKINEINDKNNIESSPEIKMKKLNSEYDNAKSICLNTMFGKVYKNALPYDDPDKNCSDETACRIMNDFIKKRTNGENSEYYIREAIRRTNSSTLKKMLNEATEISKEFYEKKLKNIGKLKMADLNFKVNSDMYDIDKINSKLELDEISDIIKNNVQNSIQSEIDKAKKEDEYNKSIEDALSNDPSVIDNTSMESAMSKINPFNQPRVYQPSLFEAISIGIAKNMTEATGSDIMTEAIHEYTKLNIIKALKLESFNIDSIKKLANSYL